MKQIIVCSILFSVLLVTNVLTHSSPKVREVPKQTRYEPRWDSLDTRPIPTWFDEFKIGIFIHWGVFSVPSFGSEWFWVYWKNDPTNGKFSTFMRKNYQPSYSYREFAKDFTAEFFDPTEWAQIFQNSGAKYVVLTSKHHEGYTLWPSKYSSRWNAGDIGPHRDLLGDLSKAVRSKGLAFGLYYSLYEWFNSLYLADRETNFTKQDFVNNKMLPEMFELINNYAPSILWVDGDWEANDIYFRSTEFLAWLYNDSPVKDIVVVNDRWGIGIPCNHGDFYICRDRYNPGVLQPHKWENAMTLDKNSWGYRRNANLSSYLTTHELIETLVQTVSCGGNILINVGPTKEGTITPIFQERLLDLGKWLSINGEAIYESKPWTVQNDTLTPGVWYTTDKYGNVYALVLQWPKNNILQMNSTTSLFKLQETTVVKLLGNPQILSWSIVNNVVNVQFPDKASVDSDWAWVLKIYQQLNKN